jgi:hypothetical protein
MNSDQATRTTAENRVCHLLGDNGSSLRRWDGAGWRAGGHWESTASHPFEQKARADGRDLP